MHEGNMDQGLVMEEDKLSRSYNDELVRYNNQFSRMVGNFHTNSDLVLKIIGGLPD
jgi:hypothetical protein